MTTRAARHLPAHCCKLGVNYRTNVGLIATSCVISSGLEKHHRGSRTMAEIATSDTDHNPRDAICMQTTGRIYINPAVLGERGLLVWVECNEVTDFQL